MRVKTNVGGIVFHVNNSNESGGFLEQNGVHQRLCQPLKVIAYKQVTLLVDRGYICPLQAKGSWFPLLKLRLSSWLFVLKLDRAAGASHAGIVGIAGRDGVSVKHWPRSLNLSRF